MLQTFGVQLVKGKTKEMRIIGLFAYIIISCIFVLIFKPYYLYSIIIVLVPPSLANYLWVKRSRAKILTFALVATFIFAPPVELALRLVDAWDVQSILPRIFGLIPIENMIFAFLNFFWVLTFYEYFVDKDTKNTISSKFKYLIDLFVFFSSLIMILYYISPLLLKTNYIGFSVIILIIPAILIFRRNVSLLKKTILVTIFFAIVFFIYEIVSLYVGSWWWPGKYYLPTVIFGKIFPIDDVIVWYFLSTPALIGGYEYFMDDNK